MTFLLMAVKFSDEAAIEMLMVIGIDCSLQNEQELSEPQEAICLGEEGVEWLNAQRVEE